MHHTWSSSRSIDGSCHCTSLEDMAHTCLNSYKKDRAVRCILVINIKRLISYLYPDVPFAVGCCPLPHSLMQLEHLLFPHRNPCEHSQTVSLLGVHFSFTRLPPGAEERSETSSKLLQYSSSIHFCDT